MSAWHVRARQRGSVAAEQISHLVPCQRRCAEDSDSVAGIRGDMERPAAYISHSHKRCGHLRGRIQNSLFLNDLLVCFCNNCEIFKIQRGQGKKRRSTNCVFTLCH